MGQIFVSNAIAVYFVNHLQPISLDWRMNQITYVALSAQCQLAYKTYRNTDVCSDVLVKKRFFLNTQDRYTPQRWRSVMLATC